MAAALPKAVAPVWRLGQRVDAERRRLPLSLLFSLAVHLLLLTLTFGTEGLGLPGVGFPWQVRRVEVPDLRVVLLPPLVTASEPLQSAGRAGLEPPVATEPALLMLVSTAPPSTVPAAANVPLAKPQKAGKPKTAAAARVAPPVTPAPIAEPTPASLPAGRSHKNVPPPTQDVMAVAESSHARFRVPPEPEVPTPAIEAAPSAPSPPAAPSPLREAGDDKQDAQRLAQQVEAERQDVVAQQAALQAATRAEVTRVEAERQEAARLAEARQEAARVEAERKERARQAAARQDAARAEAARPASAQSEAEKREERLRAIGRQLNEEADRRDALSAASAVARPSPLLPHSASTLRRGRLFGRTDPNAELILYAEAWSRKIELNMTFDMVREAAKQPHTQPLVTVAIRSDGSVESVAFVRSSGVAAIDDAVRQIIHSQANYPAFSPGLLRDYDVVEIRRAWHFDMAVRLY